MSLKLWMDSPMNMEVRKDFGLMRIQSLAASSATLARVSLPYDRIREIIHLKSYSVGDMDQWHVQKYATSGSS